MGAMLEASEERPLQPFAKAEQIVRATTKDRSVWLIYVIHVVLNQDSPSDVCNLAFAATG